MVAAKTGSLAGIAFVIAALLPWENKWLGIWLNPEHENLRFQITEFDDSIEDPREKSHHTDH